MSDPALVIKKMGIDGSLHTAIDRDRAEAGFRHTFAAAAADEIIGTPVAGSTFRVRSMVLTNLEAGARYFRLNNALGVQVFPQIAVATGATVVLDANQLHGITFTTAVHGQYSGAFAVGFECWIGGVYEATQEEAAE